MKKITDEMYAAIPALLQEGKDTAEIATLYGVAVGTLKVQCSQHGISLRRPKELKPPKEPKIPKPPKEPKQKSAVPSVRSATLVVSETTLTMLRSVARRRGVEDVQLASQLLETIAKDGLFHAVLDTEAA